jgi:F-type H+-transporting ATPase subunit delta
LDAVTDQLFAFGQLVAGDHQLRQALTDFTVPGERRRSLVRQLLADRVHPAATALAEQAVGASGAFEAAVAAALDLADGLKGRLHAEATVARPLSPAQHARLAAALAKQAGRPVTVEEVVDPAVLGGVRVEWGDGVIDGTVAARLGAARRGLTQTQPQ